VIEHLHIQQFSGLDNGACDRHIIGAGSWVA
jgi:hypothetical protein